MEDVKQRRKPFERSGPHVDAEEVGIGRFTIEWITPELLQEAREVWSEVYGQDVTAGEAVEILSNIKSLAELVLDMKREGGSR